MHLFTITIHSNLFGKELDDEILEEMAYEYLKEINISMEKRGLSNDFKVEAYWTRGSLVEHFLLILQNADIASMFTTAITYKTLKDYKDIRESVILVAQDLRKFRKVVSGINLYTKDSLISETKPPSKANKLEDKSEKCSNE